LLRRCVKVRIMIELSFGIMSGMGPGIHVLDEVHVPEGERAVSGMVSGSFRNFSPIVLNVWRTDRRSTRVCVRS